MENKQTNKQNIKMQKNILYSQQINILHSSGKSFRVFMLKSMSI